ncbi:MAG: chromate efflux transporter [Pseudomonadota bacterium]
MTTQDENQTRDTLSPNTVTPNGPTSLADLTRVWARVGVLSFGGPAAQIALMHREIVERHKWLTENQYLNALSFCMLLPGPEAMQLATYSGWRTHGVLGGIIAGLLFVLPGAFVMLALATVYMLYGSVPLVEALFLGVKAAVVIVVIEALLKVSKRALKGVDHWLIAAVAFVGIFFLDMPFPLLIVLAAAYGFWTASGTPLSQDEQAASAAQVAIPSGYLLKTIATWSFIWLAPLAVLWVVLPESLLTEIALFFSKLAIVTFGGAYAVLAYMAQDVVQSSGWLTAGEMMDGLGLAETTPGPLILVTEFVGFLAAAKQGGLVYGAVAAGITLWVTFAPCFLWIFAGAPFVDRLSHQPRLRGALNAITAAVVGVILNLSLWFALNVFFESVSEETYGPFRAFVPDVTSLDWRAVSIAFVAAALLLWQKRSLPLVLAICAALGWGTSLLT